jgi:hypothetical protein
MNRKTTMDELNNTEMVHMPMIYSFSESGGADAVANVDAIGLRLRGGGDVEDGGTVYQKSTFEILISVAIHTFIMAVFEIYFYFQYIIVIEKQLFMDKIYTYTNEINQYSDSSSTKQDLIFIFFPRQDAKKILTSLYNDYQRSLYEQRQLLEMLLIRSYKMLAVITTILVFLLSCGIYKYKEKIKWKHIMIENILMFLCLGIFEYMFFIHIILHYTPVTDEEIKYSVVKELLRPFSNTTTHTPARPLYLL